MDTERLQYMLLQASERLAELAARLTDNQGKPLNQVERTMCRAALLPTVQEICEGIILNHIQGMPNDFQHLQRELQSLEVI